MQLLGCDGPPSSLRACWGTRVCIPQHCCEDSAGSILMPPSSAVRTVKVGMSLKLQCLAMDTSLLGLQPRTAGRWDSVWRGILVPPCRAEARDVTDGDAFFE